MVFYGPWEQGANVTGDTTQFWNADYRAANTSNSESSFDDFGDQAAYVSDKMTIERNRGQTATLTLGNGATPIGPGAANFGALTSVTVADSQDASLPHPPYPFHTFMSRDDMGMFVFADPVIRDWQSRYLSTIPLPGGATGVELESDTFTVVGDVAVTIPMVDTPYGTSSFLNPQTPVWVEIYERAAATPGDIAGSPYLVYSRMADAVDPVLVNVEFTATPDPTTGGLVIYPVSQYDQSPAWSIANVVLNTMVLNRHFKLDVDTGALPTATYTLQPPRHRFTYDTPPTFIAPPLRVVQRGSDGLGMTGGKRAIGNRSRQASNRGVGYW